MNLTMPVDKTANTVPRRELILTALILVAILFSVLLVDVLRDGPLAAIDKQIANRLNVYNGQHDIDFQVATVVTQLGSTAVLAAVVIAGTSYLRLIRKQRRQALFLLATALVGTGLNNVIKVVVGRNRPHFDTSRVTAFGKSFPSGHAMNATVVYCVLLILIWSWLHTRQRRIAAICGTSLLVVLIAASRVVLTFTTCPTSSPVSPSESRSFAHQRPPSPFGQTAADKSPKWQSRRNLSSQSPPNGRGK